MTSDTEAMQKLFDLLDAPCACGTLRDVNDVAKKAILQHVNNGECMMWVGIVHLVIAGYAVTAAGMKGADLRKDLNEMLKVFYKKHLSKDIDGLMEEIEDTVRRRT